VTTSLAEQLTTAIASLPPRRDTASFGASFVPALAYGRHRGPAPDGARRAAVAIAILERKDGSMFVPLTMRPQSLRHHGGQVSLPGGKIESGESDLQAALREFEEELGVPVKEPKFCGALPPLYLYTSDNIVSPIVLVSAAPTVPWQPDLFEVDRVIELPLEVLLSRKSPSHLSRQRRLMRGDETVGEFRFRAPVFRYDEHHVWGATAMLLGELGDLIGLVSSPSMSSMTG